MKIDVRSAWTAAALVVLAVCPPCAGSAPALAECEKRAARLVVDETSAELGTLNARGSYSATNADGAFIEYHLDGDRHFAEWRSEATGGWRYVEAGQTCGQHALRIYVYPTIKSPEGLLICLAQGASQRGQVDIPCLPTARFAGCSWQCGAGDSGRCTGTCTITAVTGRPPYVAFFGLEDKWEATPSDTAAGSFRHQWTCARGQELMARVRDRAGAGTWSSVARHRCGEP